MNRQSDLFCIIFIYSFLFSWIYSTPMQGFSGPIDLVYLWVDGNDPEWQTIKNSHLSSMGYSELRPDALEKNRYSDHDELKYSLRSVYKYASFFRHIYIVTMKQKPLWLIPHPQITLVNHEEIFINSAFLPTFNSMAIECNLHRIPHLSEHFIYFNDDMFIGNLVNSSDFFTPEGNIKIVFQKGCAMPSGKPKKTDNTFLLACKNADQLLNQTYHKEKRQLIGHSPYALLTSAMWQTEQVFSDAFLSTSSHKFRSPYDYTITNGLVQYFCLYHQKAAESELRNLMILLDDDSHIDELQHNLKKIRKTKLHTFCIQDRMKSSNCDQTRKLLANFLEEYFPDPAPWENSVL